jgi:hypothetical protein
LISAKVVGDVISNTTVLVRSGSMVGGRIQHIERRDGGLR